MPTYSYRCTECSNAFDVQQSFTDDSLTVCPSCKGVLRKVFSPIGVSFTGSGFYRNDSRATPGKGKGGAESSGSGAEKSSDKSTDKASSAPAPTESKPSAASPKKTESSSPASTSGSKNVKSKPTT